MYGAKLNDIKLSTGQKLAKGGRKGFHANSKFTL